MPTLRALVTKALLPTGEGQQWALPPPRVLHSCDQAAAGESLGQSSPARLGPSPSGTPCVCSTLGGVALPTVGFTSRREIQHCSSLPVLLTRKGGHSYTEIPQENSNQPFHLDQDLCNF